MVLTGRRGFYYPEEAVEKKYGITGNTLKIIAVVLMIIDHTGAVLIENGILQHWDPAVCRQILDTANGQMWFDADLIMRTIGRPAFPIFCFLLTEGFIHTRDLKKYILRMAAFALISEIPFDLAITGRIFSPDAQNVFFTLFIGLVVLAGLEKYRYHAVLQGLVFVLGCLAALALKTDYDVVGVLMITAFYLLRDNAWAQTLFCGALAAAESSGTYYAGALALVPIRLYNGQRGRRKFKYLFYWFYPVHLLALYLIGKLIFG